MGNGIGTLTLCFAGAAGKTSRRRQDIAVHLPLDDGLGHSFCYTRRDPSLSSTSSFCTISGASISANTRTSLSTTSFDSQNSSTLDKASSFHSSNSFASIPLQPIPQNSTPSFFSAPIPQIERGFLSGPIERSFISVPLENKSNKLIGKKPKSNKWDLKRILKRTISKSITLQSQGAKVSNSSAQLSLDDGDEDDQFSKDQNLQWAQGKAGEDRIHVVISEENQCVFVGIYDGFNGPDATDYLLGSLYKNVYNELKGLLWNDNPKPTTKSSKNSNKNDEFEDGLKKVEHSEVLKALSEGLRKTEEGFLEIADMMFDENPELYLMGSCVLGMLMTGDDVYLMNVGDSRAVLAQKKDIMYNDDVQVFDEVERFSSLDSYQLTIDHSTSVEEEVLRIKREHLDDDCAVMKDRVKGSLKVTRAFGAGYLKQPKWNNALLEMFRIDYVGTSPYITCSPSLYHHKIGPRDWFLILSSDGLYQYLTNEEAVSEVETFMALFPEGDPAQHLVEEVLFRAAKKAGIDFHELLDIPQGDRRKYHDDVSVIIISLEGRIWRSSV